MSDHPAIFASESVINTLAHVVAVLKETRNPEPLAQLPDLVDGAIRDGEALLGIIAPDRRKPDLTAGRG